MRILPSAAATLLLLSSPQNAFITNTRINHNTKLVSSINEQTTTTQLHSSTLPKQEPPKTKTPTSPSTTTNNNKPEPKSSTSFAERVTNSGLASAAALATAAVNSAVATRTLTAPTTIKSYISLDKNATDTDDDGLPLSYDADLINAYWRRERGALSSRWNVFVSKAVPFLTKLVTLFIAEGKIDERHYPSLSRKAREDIQDLGPTFIKAGQMMSVRPDVLPQVALDELAILQDSVVPFSTEVAIEVIERELGGKLEEYFRLISEEPVAAASLAQVYYAETHDGRRVAIKVQRPEILSTVSKDLYVLRRAAEVFQGLIERFAPQQKTDYVALLNEWAIGFYTELDFRNEAQNQARLRQVLRESDVRGVTVPLVYEELCTRRMLVSEWIDGRKLSAASAEEIKRVTPAAQEAFLVQLFEAGFFHADPHPGNLLLLNEPTEEGHELALIDCGLMASIDATDRDNMISAVIHLANKDYSSLVDDFIALGILPPNSDRQAIVPLMDKALSPYVKGGGAKTYEAELKKLYGMKDEDMSSQVGGFQAMTQDALTVLNDVPFTIPPYFAILGRAIVTLEGVALTGDESYGLIMESYPFIARKLLKDDRPAIQGALQQVLFASDGNSSGSGAFRFSRLLALLNNAAGSVENQKGEGGAFVDLDAIPEDGISLAQGVKFLMSDEAESLRNLLETEVDNVVDIVSRQILRKGVAEVSMRLSAPASFLRPPSFLPFADGILGASSALPRLDDVPLPILLPGQRNGSVVGGGDSPAVVPPSVGMLSINEFVEAVAPKLTRDEEIYAIGIAEAASEFFGEDLAEFVRGEGLLGLDTAKIMITSIRSGFFGSNDLLSNEAVARILDGVADLLNRVDGSGGRSGSNGLNEITGALDELDEKERQIFDSIMAEIVRRTLQRASDRLANIPRVI